MAYLVVGLGRDRGSRMCTNPEAKRRALGRQAGKVTGALAGGPRERGLLGKCSAGAYALARVRWEGSRRQEGSLPRTLWVGCRAQLRGDTS